MENPDQELVGSNHQIVHATIMAAFKGPRAKRLRLNCGGADVTSSSSSGGGGGDHDFASSSVSGEEISTEEEEDMANCLILLAQGEHGRRPRQFLQHAAVKIDRNITTKRFNFDVYECKTCNRTFPSFQALGGHRASHKKPKPTTVATVEEPAEEPQMNKIPPPANAAVQTPNKLPPANLQANRAGPPTAAVAAKIHECSICGLEFTSGQALGGHMRRHRAAVSSAQQVAATTTTHHHQHQHHRHHHNHSSSSAVVEATEIKGRNILELDLNLPAPEEDLRDTKKFQFTTTPQTIVFSAPTLVDCHY